jgi:glycosyltransferase involved in cell wall biosynthesis
LHGVIAGRLARVPIIVHTKHGQNIYRVPRAAATNRFSSWLSDCVIPVSQNAFDVAIRREHVPSGRLHVIRNGIDLEAFSFAENVAPKRLRNAIHVARLDPVKDQATLLRAIRIVVDAEPGFRLTIVGDGPERRRLVQLSNELRLEDNVSFLGFRDDVHELLSSAGLFVLSSLVEGISLTLLEAMAVGLAVVATDVGGNREVVVHGETGLLVPARSPEQLAEGMLTLVRSPQMMHTMGRAARKRVEQEFDLRQVVSRYEALYLKLLADAGYNVAGMSATTETS